jgi:3-oxoacyl-[acyl-carrier protein] reductase
LNTAQNENQQQVILITGAARGIGLAIAEKLSAEGHLLALNDIHAQMLNRTIDTFEKPDSSLIGLVGDVKNHFAFRKD